MTFIEYVFCSKHEGPLHILSILLVTTTLMIQDIYYPHFMDEQLSLKEDRNLAQSHRKSKKKCQEMSLHFSGSPSCVLPPLPLPSCRARKLKRQNSGFHQIYSLTSLIHRSSPLHTCTAQTADWITSLMICYIHQCPAWPGRNWSWWDASVLCFFTQICLQGNICQHMQTILFPSILSFLLDH